MENIIKNNSTFSELYSIVRISICNTSLDLKSPSENMRRCILSNVIYNKIMFLDYLTEEIYDFILNCKVITRSWKEYNIVFVYTNAEFSYNHPFVYTEYIGTPTIFIFRNNHDVEDIDNTMDTIYHTFLSIINITEKDYDEYFNKAAVYVLTISLCKQIAHLSINANLVYSLKEIFKASSKDFQEHLFDEVLKSTLSVYVLLDLNMILLSGTEIEYTEDNGNE